MMIFSTFGPGRFEPVMKKAPMTAKRRADAKLLADFSRLVHEIAAQRGMSLRAASALCVAAR